jgi:hypothetical protein
MGLRFEVLTAVKTWRIILGIVMPCSLVGRYHVSQERTGSIYMVGLFYRESQNYVSLAVTTSLILLPE